LLSIQAQACERLFHSGVINVVGLLLLLLMLLRMILILSILLRR
jgi:hypothetical protein